MPKIVLGGLDYFCKSYSYFSVLQQKDSQGVAHKHFYECFLKEKSACVAAVVDSKSAVFWLVSEQEQIPPREQRVRDEGRTA